MVQRNVFTEVELNKVCLGSFMKRIEAGCARQVTTMDSWPDIAAPLVEHSLLAKIASGLQTEHVMHALFNVDTVYTQYFLPLQPRT